MTCAVSLPEIAVIMPTLGTLERAPSVAPRAAERPHTGGRAAGTADRAQRPGRRYVARRRPRLGPSGADTRARTGRSAGSVARRSAARASAVVRRARRRRRAPARRARRAHPSTRGASRQRRRGDERHPPEPVRRPAASGRHPSDRGRPAPGAPGAQLAAPGLVALPDGRDRRLRLRRDPALPRVHLPRGAVRSATRRSRSSTSRRSSTTRTPRRPSRSRRPTCSDRRRRSSGSWSSSCRATCAGTSNIASRRPAGPPPPCSPSAATRPGPGGGGAAPLTYPGGWRLLPAAPRLVWPKARA